MKPTQTMIVHRIKQQIDLLKIDRTLLAKVDALVYVQNSTPVLGIHPRPVCSNDDIQFDPKQFAVTYVPRGIQVGWFENQRKAKQMVALFLTLDWTQPVKGARISELRPLVRALLDGDAKLKFTDDDHCCVRAPGFAGCSKPVLLRYSVHPNRKPHLLCDHHWTKLTSDAITVKARQRLLKQMGYSPGAIRWWIAQREGVTLTKHRQLCKATTNAAYGKETEMTKKNTRRNADKQPQLPTTKKSKSKSKSKKAKKSVRRTAPVGAKKTTKVKKPISYGKPGIGKAWKAMFAANEKAKKEDRLTDEEISKAMNKQFPNRISFEFTEVAGVQSTRRHYNKGGWSDGIPPVQQSCRYDENGDRVKVHRGRIPADIVSAEKTKKVEAPGKTKAKKPARRTAPIG